VAILVRVANVLGVLGFLVYIAVVVAVAAGVTWLVVKLSPPKNQPPASES
jgi:hypothetical protein